MTKTYRLDRLYHLFLRPKGLDSSLLFELVDKLYQAGFIQLVQNGPNSPEARYSETEKLYSKEHKQELFKLVGKLNKRGV